MTKTIERIDHAAFRAILTFMLLVAVGLMSVCGGCTGSSTAIRGAEAGVESTVTTTLAKDGTVTQQRHAAVTSKGASGEASGTEAANLNVPTAPPGVAMPGADGAAGGVAASKGTEMATAMAKQAQQGGAVALVVAGVLCLGIGGAGLYLGIRLLSLVGFGVGGLLLTAALYPALMLWLMLAGVLAGVAYAAYAGLLGTRAKSALAAVVSGVESASPTVKDVVKQEIGKQATAADRAVISKMKLSEGV